MRNLAYFLVLFLSISVHSTNLEKDYRKELKAISKVEGRGNNKLFLLMTNSGKELAQDWSPELAKELARVFNSLLEVNQNSFLVELLEPVLSKRKSEFMPILEKALSPKNKTLFKEMTKRNKKESKEGNG